MSISLLQATSSADPTGFGLGSLAPTSCSTTLIVGVVLYGTYNVDPGTITSMISDKGDVFVNVSGWFKQLTGPFPPPGGPGDPVSRSVKSSVWACLKGKSGATTISVVTNASAVDYSFAEIKSTLGGFVTDASGGLTTGASFSYPINGPVLVGTGNDFFYEVLGAASLGIGSSGSFPPWSVIAIGSSDIQGYLIATGSQQMWAGNAVSHNDGYASAGVAFREVSVSFPDLSVSPSSLFFTGSGSQNVSVANVGADTLPFTAAGSPSWVSVSPSSGTALATLGISVDLASAHFLQNGDFELGNLNNWTISNPVGGTVPAVSTAQTHGGAYSCVLGSQSIPSEVDGNYSIYQLIDLPAGTVSLSFWYLPQSDFNAWDDAQQCIITSEDGSTVLDTPLYTWDNQATWQHVTRDISFLAGQTVRLYFNVRNDTSHSSPGFTFMYVDDVTITPTASLVVTGDDCATLHSPALVPISITASAPVDGIISGVVSSPSSALANGTASSTVTVTLKDSAGSPVQGKAVSLSQIGNSVISTPSGLSDANGQVLFTVTNAHVELCVYTATDTTDSVVILQTASVQFLAQRADGTVYGSRGPIISGAQIYALAPGSVVPSVGTVPAPEAWSLLSVFADNAEQAPIVQPILTDGFGAYAFYSAPSLYTLVVCNAGRVGEVYEDQEVGSIVVAFHRAEWWCKSATGPAIPGCQVFIVSNTFPNIPPTLGKGAPGPLIPLYQFSDGTGQLAQPLISDGFGYCSAFVAAGTYTVLVYLNGTLQQSYPDQSLGVVPAFPRYDLFAKDAMGRAMAGARVLICTQPAQIPLTLVPQFPSPLASVFSDPNGLVPVTQSLTYDSRGNPAIQSLICDGNGAAFFYAAPGTYAVATYVNGRLVQLLPDQTT
jgi:hypothetical protein